MATQKALVLHALDKPLALETTPRPTPGAGEAVVQILVAGVLPYMAEVLNGTRPYPLSFPITPGSAAIARIHEVGPDAVKLAPGQLVFCESTIRGRDDSAVSILLGLHGGGYPAAQKLMDGPWRNGTFAEYAKFPLENLYPLNEDVLLGKQGYSLADLSFLSVCLVPFGGLSEVDVKPGEVVIVAPATGRFGGAAVAVALAMGATVVAAGRNANALQTLEEIHASTGRLRTVIVTGDPARTAELFREASGSAHGADVYIDFSPPMVADSSLLTAGVSALRPFGRCAIQGGMLGKIEVPYLEIMLKSLRLQGRFMYSREHALRLIQMVEAGLLPLGVKAGINQIKEFGLESADQALAAAAELSGWGGNVVFRPS